MTKNSEQSNSEENMVKRLDAIISLLLDPKISGETLTKKMEYLTKMSFSNEEIARLLQTTKGSVEATKYKKTKGEKK